MAVKATIGGAAVVEYPLSFNDIIAHVPGKEGRGDATKGMFQHKSGKVLIVYSVNPQFVEIEPRRNGRKTNRTGFTRTGMAIVDTKGAMRLVTADKKPDGEKAWKVYTSSITLAGNPHVVDAPAELAGQDEGDYDD